MAIMQTAFGQKTPDLIKIQGVVVDSVNGETVITSYSIHYTKLYDSVISNPTDIIFVIW